MEASRPNSFPGPIFVGGPGRSGTHAMGRLVAAGPRYHLIRTEARFHASPGGLPDLIAGSATLDEFLTRMRGRWWRRGYGQRQGLIRVIDEERRDRALAEFEADFPTDALGAARRLVHALLDPPAADDGKPSWVEVTGHAIGQAPLLLELLPQARFINMVRDGRAVVAGQIRKINKTDDPMVALSSWEGIVRASERAMRSVPPGRMLTVELDSLAAHDRERTFRRVVEFLEVDDERRMRRYFDRRITAEAANVGRWRQRMAPQDARRVDRRYRRLVRRLHREGVDWLPTPPARDRANLRPRAWLQTRTR